MVYGMGHVEIINLKTLKYNIISRVKKLDSRTKMY